jgi:hypothetical protein
MSAPFTVLADGTPAVAPPVRLCRPEGLRAFTATADGERILGLVEDDRFAPPQIRVTFHWTGLTKR